VSDYKKGYQPRTNLVKIRRAICLETPKLYCPGGGTISVINGYAWG